MATRIIFVRRIFWSEMILLFRCQSVRHDKQLQGERLKNMRVCCQCVPEPQSKSLMLRTHFQNAKDPDRVGLCYMQIMLLSAPMQVLQSSRTPLAPIGLLEKASLRRLETRARSARVSDPPDLQTWSCLSRSLITHSFSS